MTTFSSWERLCPAPPVLRSQRCLSSARVSVWSMVQGLKGVSFEVPAGTTTAIVGHTGSGTTTIARLLFR